MNCIILYTMLQLATFKHSSQVDIVDLHSCPDDDRSMVIETVHY